MKDVLLVFAGLPIGFLANYLYHLIFRRRPSGTAYRVLKKLKKHLKNPEGEYFFTKTTQQNWEVARDIFQYVDGRIVATAFNENPADYGGSDLARSFRYGGDLITRLSAAEVCDESSEARARESLEKIKTGARLIVIPRGERYTRIDGIFCCCDDGTHLAFVALKNPDTGERNEGVVFRDGFAAEFFEYYQALGVKHGA